MSFINTTFSKKLITEVTLSSGPCESSLIQVGVLLSALKNSLEINVPGLFSFFSCLPFAEPVCREKYRGAGLARIRIWGGRQHRSCHKCAPCDKSERAGRGQQDRANQRDTALKYASIFRQSNPAFSGVKIVCNRFCGAGWYSLTY